MNIQEKIISIISSNLNINVEDIKLESKLIQDLESDELDNIEICMEIEDEFKIDIPDEDADKFVTVKDIVEYVKKKTDRN